MHRYLSQDATIHIQYLVFLFQGTEQQVGGVRRALEDLIKRTEDEVRIYRLPTEPSIRTIGAQGLPKGCTCSVQRPRQDGTADGEVLW